MQGTNRPTSSRKSDRFDHSKRLGSFTDHVRLYRNLYGRGREQHERFVPNGFHDSQGIYRRWNKQLDFDPVIKLNLDRPNDGISIS